MLIETKEMKQQLESDKTALLDVLKQCPKGVLLDELSELSGVDFERARRAVHILVGEDLVQFREVNPYNGTRNGLSKLQFQLKEA